MDIDVYEKLISTTRFRESSYPGRSVIVEAESDRGRVVFSSAFRRLQQKAQVFPLESNAAVRTRLTHSLEVAHTGRYLAQQVLSEMRERVPNFKDKWLEANEQAFLNVVETACLIHDIGNPPFGHFGEAAIRDWFKRKGKDIVQRLTKEQGWGVEVADYLDAEYRDFLTFDGNAQGLRVISKLQGEDGKSGLNLTYSLIGAYLKYACLPSEIQEYSESSRFKKPGFFYTEKELIYGVWDEIGMDKNTRYPLSYLMEAADDIAYCLSDVEDGIEKSILTEAVFFSELEDAWNKRVSGVPGIDTEFLRNLLDESMKLKDIDKFIAFKTKLINHLVRYAASQYCDKHIDIVNGVIDGLIRGECKEQKILQAVRDVVGKIVFQSSQAESIELAGYSTVTGLLGRFERILSCGRDQFSELMKGNQKYISKNGLDYERRLLNRLSSKSKKAYEKVVNEDSVNDIMEWHLRAHMLVDNITGMTDDFALETYQLLEGIKVET